MVSVVEARVSTAAAAHQDSTGICALSSMSTTFSQARDLDLDAREALHQRDIAERVGGALGDVGIVAARPCSAAARSCAITSAISTVKTTHSTISSSASAS